MADKKLVIKTILHELINIRRVTGGDFASIMISLINRKASKEEFIQCLTVMGKDVERADKSIRQALELI